MRTDFFDDVELSDSSATLFGADVRALVAMPRTIRESLLSAFPSLLHAGPAPLASSARAQLVRRFVGEVPQIKRVIELLEFIAQRILRLDKSTNPGEIAADVGEYANVSSDADMVAIKETILRIVHDIAPAVRRQALRDETARGVLPSLTGFGATVELRAVQERRYVGVGSVEHYLPTISDIVPVASLVLTTDSSSHQNYYLQADEQELGVLIRALQATAKDLRALHDRITFVASPRVGDSTLSEAADAHE